MVAALLAPLVVATALEPGESEAAVLADGLTTTPVLTGLNAPVNFAFDADGGLFVALKAGLVQYYDGAGDTTPTTVIDLRAETYDHGDRGLLGMALDPDFESGSPYLYLLYSYDRDPFGTATVPRWGGASGGDDCPNPPGPNAAGCTSSGRLVKVEISEDHTANVATTQVLLDGAAEPTGGWCSQFPSHSIGTVQFGPDGMLYVGAGDGASYNAVDYGQFGGTGPTPPNPCNDGPGVRGTALTAADSAGGALRSQAVRAATSDGYVTWDGAILRVDPETGAAPSDNPLVGNGIAGDDRIVAYGLRNPFRFGFRDGTNELWLGDVGWGTFEEINVVETGPGQSEVPNFGWPCFEGPNRQGGYDAANLGLCESLYAAGDQTLGGVPSPLVMPYLAWPRAAAQPAAGCSTSGGGSVTGGTFVTSDAWPAQLHGAYVFADYARGCIVAVPLGADGQPDPAQRVALVNDATAVSIQVGPGGDLYYADIVTGSIQRLRPLTANQPPVAAFEATPTSGAAPLTVAFDASASSDPDGDTLSYAWDLDGDGGCDDATGVTTTRTYTAVASVTVTLCVTDALGETATASRTIDVENQAPQVSLTASSEGTGWAVGDDLVFTATGTDAEDGTLPDSAYAWSFQIRHCVDEQSDSCHTHPLSGAPQGSVATLSAPDHEYYAYIVATVTVTDSVGATAAATVEAHPRISTITLDTNPSGVSGVSVGPGSGTAPVAYHFLENGVVQLIVPESASVGGQQYLLDGWADDAAAGAVRTLVAPPGASSYLAQYSLVDTPPVIDGVTAPSSISLPWWAVRTVTVSAHVTDDQGVSQVSWVYVSPSGQRTTIPMSRVSGTATDGIYRGQLTLSGLATTPGRYSSEVSATTVSGQSTTVAGPATTVRVCLLLC